MDAQHRLLNEVADAGRHRHDPHDARARTLGTINAANLKRAHAMVESGRTRGKLVLEGF